MRHFSEWTHGEDLHADAVHGVQWLPSRTPSPFFWPDDTTGGLPLVHYSSCSDGVECTPTALRYYEWYDGCNVVHASTSADRLPCPVCLYPLVPKKRKPCEACKRRILAIISRKQRRRGPASNRWYAPEKPRPDEKDLFAKMTDIACRIAKHTVASKLWSLSGADLLTRSKELLRDMNRASLRIRTTFPGYNTCGQIIRRPDEDLRKKNRRLISQLEEQTVLSHQRRTCN